MIAADASFRKKVLKGFFWLSAGTFLGQTISWVSTIIVIRLLLPSDYGLMAMAASFVSLLTSFSEMGIGASIIQAKDMEDEDIRKIFGVVLLISVFACLVSYLAAPFLSFFYREEKLSQMVRVLSVNFLLSSLYIVPQALLVREMNFKKTASIDVIAQISASAITLVLAVMGSGVWALVLGLNAMNLVKCIGFNLSYSSWIRPVFRFRGAEKFILFGLNITSSRMLYYLYSVADTVIVGRYLGNFALGIYSVAMSLATTPADKVLPLINQISFTSYSRIQGDMDRVRKNLLRTSRTIALSGFPIFWGMAAVAPEAIPLILGSKWSSAVVPFQLLCFVIPLKALSPILASTVSAIGKPTVNFVNTAITCVVMILSFLVGVRYGLYGICMVWVVAYPIIFTITGNRTLKVLGVDLKTYFSAMNYPMVVSAIMFAGIVVARKILHGMNALPFMILCIITGISLYSSCVVIFMKEEITEIKGMVLDIIK